MFSLWIKKYKSLLIITWNIPSGVASLPRQMSGKRKDQEIHRIGNNPNCKSNKL